MDVNVRPSLWRRFQGWMAAQMPTREGMQRTKWLRPIAHRFLAPELWRFTRRSVPRGVALGMFAAFIIPLGQIFLAAFMAPWVRANVPIAAAATFITNPFTITFWVWVANQWGSLLLQVDQMTYGEPVTSGLKGEFGQWVNWFFLEAGVTAFGFLTLALTTAAIGYVVSNKFWQWRIRRKWRTRHSRKRRAS